MNRRLLGMVFLAAAAGLAGCGSGSRARTDATNGPSVDPEAAADLGYRIQWVQNLALPGNSRFAHAEVLGDRLVTLDTRNIATVIHNGDGRVLWSSPVGSTVEVFTEPVRSEKMLLLESQSRAYTFDLNNGQQLRQIALPYAANTRPILIGEQFISGSPTGMIFAQDTSRGLLRWNYKMESAISTPPVLAGPSLVVTTQAGHVAAFNPANGALIWRQRAFDRISATPAVTDMQVFVASEDQSLYAYDRASGNLAWRHYSDVSLRHSPFVVPDTELVLQRIRNNVLALNTVTGRVMWQLEDFPGTPVLVRSGVVVFDQGGRVALVNAADGKLVKQVGLPGVQRVMTDNVRNGAMFLQRAGGQFTKLVPRG